jgi:glycosyltransferase involved in cell wall biosynthesis
MTSSNWGFYDKVIFCLLARLVGVKSVLNPVGGHFIIFHQRNAFNRFWVPVCLGIPNAVISGTTYWHNYFNSQFKIKVLVDIPNPVRLKTMPLEPDCPGRPFTLTYLARVEFDKGIDIFLEVMNQLKERKDDSQFVIAGTGSKLQWVKDTLETPEWEGNVRIAGFVDELAKDKIFRETDVYLLPTEFEVLPISILEAMSFGNIVITTPVGGIPDAIIHGSTGILKERIDLNGIVSSILELKSNPRLRERISQNAIRHCKGKYDMNVVVAEQMKLFNSIME